MNFRFRDILVGVIVIALIVTLGVFYKNKKSSVNISSPAPDSFIPDLSKDFNYQIPQDVDSIELKDVAGGDSRGIATRKALSDKFEHVVLADLPNLSSLSNGDFYEGWLVMGNKFVSTGKMDVVKGGFLLEFVSKTDYSDYNKVVITQESKFDSTPEKHVLEGTF